MDDLLSDSSTRKISDTTNKRQNEKYEQDTTSNNNDKKRNIYNTSNKSTKANNNKTMRFDSLQLFIKLCSMQRKGKKRVQHHKLAQYIEYAPSINHMTYLITGSLLNY